MQRWSPSGPVVLLAGTPAGGGQDRAARALADALAATGVDEVDVRNVIGRGGGVAWRSVSRRHDDGHVLAISSPTLVTNAIADPSEVQIGELAHLALLCTEYFAFVAPPDGRELASVLSREGTVAAVATSLHNVNHAALAAVTRRLGTDPRRLDVRAFGSARTAVAEVASGAADVCVVSAASALPEFEEGSVRIVAVSAPARMPGPLAGVPTWTELGVSCEFGTWRGVVAPSGLDPGKREFWTSAIERAARSDAWRDALGRHLWSDTLLLGPDAEEFVAREDRRLRAALLDLGVLRG
jgi:putative tricarboxylic transport membrane protein